MQVDIGLNEDNLDGIAKLTFRQAAWGRLTWDDYNSKQKHLEAFFAPTVWFIFEIADHLNATLEAKPRRASFEQRTEITPWKQLDAHQILENRPSSRNMYLKFGYYTFGYCTNGTGRQEATSMLAFFRPLDPISWSLLGFVIVTIAVLTWFAGHGFRIFRLVACLGSQSFRVNSNARLATLLVLWHLVAFMVFSLYTAFLESVLAVPSLLPRIQDFKALNQSCEVPWVSKINQPVFTERFQGIQHLEALIGRSKVTESTIEPIFFRSIVEHENQCTIFQISSRTAAWPELGAKFQPGATCSVGKEKLIGDPYVWHIFPPNAAVIYRTIRALDATGILRKFGEYFDNRKKDQHDHFVTERLQLQRKKHNLTQNPNDSPSKSENVDIFAMANIQMVLTSYLVLNFCAFCVFLVECIQLFLEIT